MNTYTIEQNLIDDEWTRKFAFNAKSEKEAESKAMGWARYHSFTYGTDVRFREATEEEATSEWFLNNEWVS